MKSVFCCRFGARLVSYMARVATHVEGGVPASLLRHMQPGLMTLTAEIFFFAAGYRLEQLIFVFARVRIVAVEAVANRRRVYRALDIRCLFLGVAGDAQA